MIKFSYVNLLEAGEVSASSEETTLPAEYAVFPLKQKGWRATGDDAEWIKFDLGSAQSIKFMAIAGHNLSSSATVKFQMNATDVWTSPSVDVTVTWNEAIMLYEWASGQSYQWVRISIVDPSNPDGYVEVGIAWAGAEVEPSRNARAYRIIPIDPSMIEESSDGAETGAKKAKYNVVEYEFRNIDYSTFKTLWAAVGLTEYFFIVTDYDNEILTDGRHELSFYGKLERAPEFDSSYRDRGNVRLSMKEAR